MNIITKKIQYQPIRGLQAPVTQDLVSKFLDHVHSFPKHIAIRTSIETLSYQDLYSQVLHWRAFFSQHYYETMVVSLDRSPRLVAVLIALLWLQIPYIPIDQSLPIKRIKTILEDSHAEVFLYDAKDSRNFDELDCVLFNLNHFESEDMIFKHDPLPVSEIHKQTLAYIIYTSGSTGKPKGVAVSRLALNNFLTSMSRYFMNEDESVLLATTTIAFDIAALELFLPLWQRKTIFLSDQQEHQDPLRLIHILKNNPISHLQATPSMWKLLTSQNLDTTAPLVALCGGEPLNSELAKTLLSTCKELWNMYGPTEATIWCAIKQIQPGEPITIGRPIDNTELCVMDSSFNILPPYVKGALYISGLCLAEGYINNSKLTKERFIPWKKALRGFLYEVGDIACSTTEGEFIIFGRSDNQIKLHGYRIELEEIEAQIQRVPGIREAAAHVYKEQLVAYLCLSDDQIFSETEFKKHLRAYLPEYMLPSRIVYLDKLPISTSGKIIRESLPLPSSTFEKDADHLSPIQTALISIWATELGMSTIGLHDNFFELGGHSLVAARIILKCSEQFKKQMNVNDIYQAPTIALFSNLLMDATEKVQTITIANKNKNWQPLEDFQLTLWMARFFEPQIKKVNNAARRRIKGQINKKALDLALQLILQKQEILTYKINPFFPAQKQQQDCTITWIETSLVHYEEKQMEDCLAQSFDKLFHHRFWGSPCMLSAKLFYLSQERIELQIAFSHFITDEESIEIFFNELSNAYHFYTDYLILNAKEPAHSFISYVNKKNALTSKNLHEDIKFWKNHLKDAEFCYFPSHHIVKDKQKDLSTHIQIPEQLLSQLQAFCLNNHVTINEALSASIVLTLKASGAGTRTDHAKLFMNTVRSTRDDPNYDKVMGCFLYLHSFKVDWTKHHSLPALSKHIQKAMMETLHNQQAPNFVKFAYNERKTKLQQVFIFLLSLFSRGAYLFKLDPNLIKACISLMFSRSNNGFMININILSSFLTRENANPKLLNLPIQPIPKDSYPVIPFKQVFDLCFYRNGSQPTLIITSNLSRAFRTHFAKTFLETLHVELEMTPQPRLKNSDIYQKNFSAPQGSGFGARSKP